MRNFTEDEVEDAALEWLAGLGYAVLHGPDIGPEGPVPERRSYGEVMLSDSFEEALRCLNPQISDKTLEDISRKVRQTETPSLVEENRRPPPLPGRRAVALQGVRSRGRQRRGARDSGGRRFFQAVRAAFTKPPPGGGGGGG